MDAFPVLTLEEAQARLPLLRPRLARLRAAFHAYRFAKEQLAELRAFHGPPVEREEHAEHEELQHWRRELLVSSARVRVAVRALNDLGADVKDPVLGLVDFHARRGDEPILLCYRDDEPTIAHWHAPHEGFAGRRPLDAL